MIIQQFKGLIGIVIVLASIHLGVQTRAAGARTGDSSVSVDVSVAEVISAWHARESAIKSFHFRWSVKRTLAKGAVATPEMRKDNPKGGWVPAEAASNVLGLELTVEADRMRFVRNNFVFGKGELNPTKSLTVSDGEFSKSFTYPGPGLDRPVGGQGREKINERDLKEFTLLPLRHVYRPFGGELALFKVAEFEQVTEVLAPNSLVEGTECVLLRQGRLPDDRSELERRYWLDPRRGFAPLRIEASSQGKLRYQIDFQEYKDDAGALVPLAWKATSLAGDGSITAIDEATVQDSWVNRAVDISEFQFEFPVGTQLNDRTTRTKSIVRQGGNRPVTAADAGLTFAEMLGTDPGGLPRGSSSHWWWVAGVSLAACSLVLLSWLVMLKRRRKQAQEKS